ncbi:interactor protein for cytohesin exchange factors 1 [Bufo gargarizans]|uniref:interactor protein for cytohesin exchange factors 1 n=1 Tax=Bufo gargarizans TaxID=30331 RepID=UPI001CF5DA63|nr:interactor protein for cytohesin exchange factors 1 [Bufo gargarizans]XP_044145539.1 interactor protein for cytohesin exchange factors 1 [Bufo gargarizans]XP_044145540.1 interactor protein for cytohesin exchange factors 1 [Bufo gargarizans]
MMASEGTKEVSLRSKQRRKSRVSIFKMSRRRISCKELGDADCQGWLYKKKEKSFLGNKWKKIWAVLKGSCLYWYTSQMAEKAEGFINLSEFIVNPATDSKKKYAVKISHPKTKAFYFAAENREEMNKWLNKLGLAVITHPIKDKKDEDCWSESEHDDHDLTSESPSFAKHNSPSISSELAIPLHVRSLAHNSGSSLCIMEYQEKILHRPMTNSSSAPELEKLFVEQNLYQKKDVRMLNADFKIQVEEPELNTSLPSMVTEGLHMKAKDDDEMEKLYKSLEEASLSPIGDHRPSSRIELRKSFIKRSKNPSINEKLHKIRTLNSTLKCKEHDLAMINQLLESGEITSEKYREWKDNNTLLFQDLYSSPCVQVSADNTTLETSFS